MQADGLIFMAFRFGQVILEAAVLAASPAFIGYCLMMAAVDAVSGEAKFRDFYEEVQIPKTKPFRWAAIALFALAGAAFRPLFRWLRSSDYALVRSSTGILLSVLAPAWVLGLLWLLYARSGKPAAGSQSDQPKQ